MNQKENLFLPSAFFLSSDAPCPYLEGKQERKLFTFLSPENETAHHDLNLAGFRRSQNIMYRPACETCQACLSSRLVVNDYKFKKHERRVIKRNAHLVRKNFAPIATREQYSLLTRYLKTRHTDSVMAKMRHEEYRAMVEESFADSYLMEYRDDKHLVACALGDKLPDGLSLVYSFFDPDYARNSLGTFIILDHIRTALAAHLPYVYLGYIVGKSPKMAYKKHFQPLQVQTGKGWRLYEEDKQ